MVRREGDELASDPLAETASDPLGATVPASGARAETAVASDDSGVSPAARLRGPVIPTGTKVGRYVITEQLGSGGMGTVYAAKDPELGRRVAIKLLHAHLASMQTRLLREGRAIARLRHPNVVTIHDVGTHEGNLFIAMEHVAGTTLRGWLQKPHTWREICDTFFAAGRGLIAAHAAGIVHRDFKPDNVLLGDDGSIVVTDFGLARAVDAEPDEANEPNRRNAPAIVDVTVTGSYVGTPAYMSPEQFRGEPADERSDQFSFCVALYEALYGQRPFGGKTFEAMQREVLVGAIARSPSEAKVPASVHAAILRGLERDIDRRHPSMTALLEALVPRQSARRRVVMLTAISGTVAAVFLVGALIQRRNKTAAVVDPCVSAVAPIDPTWNEHIRSAMLARYGDSPSVAEVAWFETFATGWKDLRKDACKRAAKPETRPLADRQIACLDAALQDFIGVVRARKPTDTDWPHIPSLQRCREDAYRPPAVTTVRKNVRASVLLAPDGSRVATLDHERLSIMTIEGKDERAHTIPDAAFVVQWPHANQLVLLDRTLQKLLSVHVESGTTGQSPFVPGAQLVSADIQQALLSANNGDVRLQSLVAPDSVRTIARLPLSRLDTRALAWSDSTQRIAMLLGPRSALALQVIDLDGTNRALPVRAQVQSGLGSLLFRDDERLLFVVNGGSHRGIWSMRLDPDGRLVEPPELRLAAAPNTTFRLEDHAAGRVLARTISARQEITRIHDGRSLTLPTVADVRRLKGITSDGRRMAIECRDDVGVYDVESRSYVRAGDREDVIAAAGERILVAHGNDLLEVQHDGTSVQIAKLPESSERRHLACAHDGKTCVVLSSVGAAVEMRVFRGQQLSAAFPLHVEHRISDVALSPDGLHVAVAGGALHVDVISIASTNERIQKWWMAKDAFCADAISVAWAAEGKTLFASQECQSSTSRLLKMHPAKRSTLVFASDALIGGFAATHSGDLIINQIHQDADLVIIDGL